MLSGFPQTPPRAQRLTASEVWQEYGESYGPVSADSAQRLTASEVWQWHGRTEGIPRCLVLNALRHQRFGSLTASPSQAALIGAQRLTASEVWQFETLVKAGYDAIVLNALRHQRFGRRSRDG